MNLEEMKRIANKRHKEYPPSYTNFNDFCYMADMNWDKLIAVVEATKELMKEIEYVGHFYQDPEPLKRALKALEE